jgi:hypothetical protein
MWFQERVRVLLMLDWLVIGTGDCPVVTDASLNGVTAAAPAAPVPASSATITGRLCSVTGATAQANSFSTTTRSRRSEAEPAKGRQGFSRSASQR